MNLYRHESSIPKYDAQRNLEGRTHYVDDGTLRYFKSRILSASVKRGGLLFTIIESSSADYEHRSRTFRYVIFDVFGTIISRPGLDEGFKNSDKAHKAMVIELEKINAKQITRKAIKRAKEQHKDEMARLQKSVREL